MYQAYEDAGDYILRWDLVARSLCPLLEAV
jgi:hypothetical protein